MFTLHSGGSYHLRKAAIKIMDFDDGDMKEEQEIGRQVECMKGMLEISVCSMKGRSGTR